MNRPAREDRLLDSCIDSIRRSVDDAEFNEAVARFRWSLPHLKRDIAAPRTTALRWAGVTAILALTITVAPLILLQSGDGAAFAQVQEWFGKYRTLHIVMTMKQDELQVNRLEIWNDPMTGSTRINVPPLGYIFDAGDNSAHVLLPDNQVITYEIGGAVEANAVQDQLSWLQQLRDFQGEAEVVDVRRDIGGIEATGFQLSIGDSIFTLWADPSDNRPLLVNGTLPVGLVFDARIEFDQTLPTGIFEVPADYRVITP